MLAASPTQNCLPPLRPLPIHSLETHLQSWTASSPDFAPKSRRIRTSAKYARNPFTMNTSKTKDLKSFRMNTYEKTGRGVAQTVRPARLPELRKQPVALSLRESLLGRPLSPSIASLPLYVVTSSHRCLTASALARALYSLLPVHDSLPPHRLTKPHPSFNVKCLSDT
jgi:hypothetical protein